MKDDLLPTELARLCGVSADTIRHYERKGVIPPPVREATGYRRFPRETAERVRLVRRALAIGFSLDEIARMFRRRAAGMPPCREVRRLAGEKLAGLGRRIEELTALRDELASLVGQWDERLAVTADGEPAHLLETLEEKHERPDDRPSPRVLSHAHGAHEPSR